MAYEGGKMALQSVTVQLPPGLYNRLKRRAEQAHRSIEAEVVEAVASAVPAEEELSPEVSSAVAGLATADDATLWRAAKAQFPAEKSKRLEKLHMRIQAGNATEADVRQAAELSSELEQFMFWRAQAMSFLMQRGHTLSALTE